MAGSERHTNRLAQESSPYLLQHAHNPVDWYPWGPEAFAEARASGRLILLSVGYSACHWCHVMERECFEDAGIAAQMNEHFVNVKVDREERPDVDHVYMQVVQAMTGHGGWPMTVFLTPEGVPIFGGTYFPPEDRRGMPGFPRVMAAVRQTYAERGEQVVGNGRELLERIAAEAAPRGAEAVLSGTIAADAAATLARQFDPRYGGMDRAPKFPQPMTWEALLRHWARTGDGQAAEMVRTTLVRMARGGIYDQVGGGFHRYSTDGRWLVPHFEKMLYDNGQLARLYLDGWRAFGDPELRRVCEQTLDYVARELRDPAGGFYSATDADSEGEEGRFFVWTPEEVSEVLGEGPVAEAALALWDLGARANFEGAWILHVPRDPAEVAARLGIDRETLEARIGEARAALYARRAQRVPPGLDDKVLASWNGLACRAFAEAGAAFGRSDYVAVAEANVRFVLGAMRREDGRLLRTWKAGVAKIPAFLEDYANTVDALLAVYGATLDGWYAEEARGLADAMIDLFWDEGAGGFFDTGRDAEALVVRPRDFFDNAAPCGGSVAAEVLVRLATLTGEARYRELAERGLRSTAGLMGRYPGGFGRWLCALDQYLGPDLEVTLVWPASDAGLGGAQELRREVVRRYLPRVVLAARGEGAAAPSSPLFEGREARGGAATAYVCVGATCLEPAVGTVALGAQLDGLPRG